MTTADFAAARQRALERHRELQNVPNRRDHRIEQSSNTLIGSTWTQRALRQLHSQWTVVSGREGTRPAFRVGQVDAELLDEELIELLRSQVGEALKYYSVHLRDDWASEILLMLRTILFKLSFWDHNASYGASLQNLQYCDARRGTGTTRSPPSRTQKVLYGLLSIGGRYAWTKWEDRLLTLESSYGELSPLMKRLSSWTSTVAAAHGLAGFASFLVFLLNGRYRTLLDRILRLRLLPTTSQVSREISFEYLNRQLVWHAFTEFLLFLLPLVGISRWRKWLARAWRKIKTITSGAVDEAGTAEGELAFLPERTCAICYQDQSLVNPGDGEVAAMIGSSGGVVGSSQTDVTNPYECLPCGCVYCYVCIAQRLESEDGDGWICLRCGKLVNECQPWDGDVIEEKSRPSSGKSVTFAADTKKGDPVEAFEELDPVPMENEKEKELQELIEDDAQRGSDETTSADALNESGEWIRTSQIEHDQSGLNVEEDDEDDHEDEYDAGYEDYDDDATDGKPLFATEVG